MSVNITKKAVAKPSNKKTFRKVPITLTIIKNAVDKVLGKKADIPPVSTSSKKAGTSPAKKACPARASIVRPPDPPKPKN